MKLITKKALSLFLTFAMLFGMVQGTGVTAFAASNSYDQDSNRTVLYVDSGDISIGDGTVSGYDAAGNPVTSADTDGYVITQHDSGTTTQHMITVTGGMQNISLRGVNINHPKGSPVSAFSIAAGAAVNLTLEDTNTLIGGRDHAGLEVPASKTGGSDASLIITEQSSGSLETTGDNGGAGIGGSFGGANGAITVRGGTVTATGIGGAGIGGGCYCAGGTITISGGVVTATSNIGGAGIGAGQYSKAAEPTVIISGGTVTAASDDGAGIGGGCEGNGGNITISGGTVTATGIQGAGIGGGYMGSGGIITISSGTVTATGIQGAGIGGGGGGAGSTLIIKGCSTQVTAKGTYGKDIGCGSGSLDEKALTVGEAEVTNGPVVKLQSAGISSNYTFKNCTITGVGAKAYNYKDIKGKYDKDGHILLNISLTATQSSTSINKPVTLAAAVTKYGFTDLVSPTGDIAFSYDGSLIGKSPVSNGKASYIWVPSNVKTYNLTATYSRSGSSDPYAYASIMVPVTITANQESHHSSSTETEPAVPSIPTVITEVSINTTADLSGVTLPTGVTEVSLNVVKKDPANKSDPQAESFGSALLANPKAGVIGSPIVYHMELLDQNRNVTFGTGKIKITLPVPPGLRGTPHVLRYEPSGTFTDMNAKLENGMLVFETDRLGYFAVAGIGDSITLDTTSYTMPVNSNYEIGLRITGTKETSLKAYSINTKVVGVTKLKNGNYKVTSVKPGNVWIMLDVYDNKNKLLTHASVRVDVKTGIRPRGDSTRQVGVF